jgi:hypothetical protein
MALVVKDRVKETTTTTGTGTVTLAGASTGFQGFSAIGDGNSTYYTIAGQTGSEWEVGIGTYTASGTTLSRTTVLSSSNSGSLVSFSAGTKDVFCTYPAAVAAFSSGNTTYIRTTFTATAGQTAFTVNYTVGALQVFLNGVLLATSDYTATSGTGFTLSVAAGVGDIVEAAAFNSSAYTRTSFTATAGQTVFSAAYTPGYLQMYVNGVFLSTTDYTATDGTTITLGVAAGVGDTVDAINVTVTAAGSVTIGKSIVMAMIFGY